MNGIIYDGNAVNSAVSDINKLQDKFSLLSSSIKHATNQIVAARGFNEYIGGLTTDTFSDYTEQCGEMVGTLVQSIRQKQVSILAYSKNQSDINAFLDTLDRKDYSTLDLSSIDSYISFGRRVGNFFKGIGADVVTGGLGVVEGILDFGETACDLVHIGGTMLASIFTKGYDLLTGSDATTTMWNQTKASVSEKKVESIFDHIYAETEFGRDLKNNAYGFDVVRGVGKGLGYTAGLIGVNVLTGGLASGLGVGAARSITAGQLATTAGIMGFSNGTEEAWADGATTGKGLLYGTASGVWEGAQWYAGAKINQIGGWGDNVAKGIFKGATSGVGVRIGLDTLDSGVEGFVQPALTMIYKDYGGNSFAENYAKAFQASGGWANVASQAAIGAFGSAIGEFTGARKLLKEAKNAEMSDGATAGAGAGAAGAGEGAGKASEIFNGDGEGRNMPSSKGSGADVPSRPSVESSSEAPFATTKKGVMSSPEGNTSYRNTDIREGMSYTTGTDHRYDLSGGIKGDMGDGALHHMTDEVRCSTISDQYYDNDQVQSLLRRASELSGDPKYSSTADRIAKQGQPISTSGSGNTNKAINNAIGVIRESGNPGELSQFEHAVVSRTVNTPRLEQLASQSGIPFPDETLLRKTTPLTMAERQTVEQYAAEASKQIYGTAIENYDRGMILVDGKIVHTTDNLLGVPVYVNGAQEGSTPYYVEILAKPTTREGSTATVFHMFNQSPDSLGVSVPTAVQNQAQRAINLSLDGGKSDIIGSVIEAVGSDASSDRVSQEVTKQITNRITTPGRDLYIPDPGLQRQAIQYVQDQISGGSSSGLDQLLSSRIQQYVSGASKSEQKQVISQILGILK